MPNLAIVRGFGGEPLCRAIAGHGNGVVFVASIEAKAAEFQGFPPAIGVPKGDAFAYTAELFERLRNKWKAGKSISSAEWGRLVGQ